MIPRRFRPLLADGRGSSAVEFSLIAPILIVMIGSIFTIGMILRAHTAISTYAREAARGLAVGYMTESEAKQFAESHAAAELSVVVTAVIDPATKGDKNDPDVVVTVAISQDEMAKMTPFGGLIPGGIQSRATMRSLVE